jgi:hypothetical protein
MSRKNAQTCSKTEPRPIKELKIYRSQERGGSSPFRGTNTFKDFSPFEKMQKYGQKTDKILRYSKSTYSEVLFSFWSFFLPDNFSQTF